MDPLSMTASIIAILQLTTLLTNCINDVRNATKEQQAVAIEASNLYSLLTSLRYRVEAAQKNDHWFGQIKALGTDNGPLHQFKTILQELVDRITSHRRRDQIMSTLAWPFNKGEVDRLLSRIERLKTLINCALTNDLVALAQAIHGDMAASEEQLRRIDERLHAYFDEELQSRILRWLDIPDTSSNYRAALEKRLAQTDLWLLEGQDFQKWKQATRSFMWLHGKPGCGKTVLSAAALQNIQHDQPPDNDVIIAYFYFDFNEINKQSSKKAIRSLLWQCARQDHDGSQALRKLYSSCGDGHQQPAEDTMRFLLQDILRSPKRKYLLLDALDECTDREYILTFLQTIADINYAKLYLFATSRRERDIDEILSEAVDYSIDVESAIVEQDIRLYVQDRLSTDLKLKKWSETVRKEISDVLMTKAGGMFRWVFCQLDSLRGCIKLSALRKALTSLPTTLDETYERILQDLQKRDTFTDTIKILQWLVYSGRPLHLLELREVIAIENGEDGKFHPDDRLPDPTDIMVLCSSLISLQAATEDKADDIAIAGETDDERKIDGKSENDPNDNIDMQKLSKVQVGLAHFSVQEYLTSNRCLFKSYFEPQLCHAVISEGCLRYQLYLQTQSVLKEDNSEKLDLKDHPLVKYLAFHWNEHIELAGESADGVVVDLAMNLFNEKESLRPWMQLVQKFRYHRGRFEPYDHTALLVYAAYFNLSKVVQRLLKQGADVNAKGRTYGSALTVASRNGHEKIVQILLDNGADVNAKGGDYRSALTAASENGHEQIVQILLDNWADVNLPDDVGKSALYRALQNGYEEIAQMLREHGATEDS